MFWRAPPYLLTQGPNTWGRMGLRSSHTLGASCALKDPPELDVQHGGVGEVGHALDVENVLDLSAPFYDGVHRLGVHVQLWRRWSRTLQGHLLG